MDDEPRPWNRSAVELAARVRAGDADPRGLVWAALDRIEERDDAVGAFVTVTEDLARRRARAVARGAADGADRGPLAGVPLALKDLNDLKAGVRHTFGSALFAENVADRTTVAVQRLEAAGAVVVGKTNTPAFGHRATTVSAVGGETRSPVAPSLNAGGSSGGSAAAVAAGMASVATGSDAGGSIRIPAAACGVLGFKPSTGVVPRDSRPNAYGARGHRTTIGPLARTVADAALTMDVLAGPHPRDPTSAPVDVDYRAGLERDAEDLSVAYSPALDAFPVADAVTTVVEDALDDLTAAGATVDRVHLDHGLSMDELADAVGTTFTAAARASVETLRASAGLDLRDHVDAVPDAFLAMVERGEGRDAAALARADVARTTVYDALRAVFAEYDVLVTPTLAVDGFEGPDAVAPDDWDVALTWPFNWTGQPAASVPAGVTADERPIGLQVVAPRYCDERVIAASAALERVRPWHDLYPD